MAIDPSNTSSVRLDQLPYAPFNLSDKLPHEIGSDLKNGTVQELADVISDYIGTSSSIAFRPITVADGSTLPSTTQAEWILVGKGTFTNVGGGANITTTEELNALISNGTYWSIGVEIPISAEASGITQYIRSGFTTTAPSEDALFNALGLKADLSDLGSKQDTLVSGVNIKTIDGSSILGSGNLNTADNWTKTGDNIVNNNIGNVLIGTATNPNNYKVAFPVGGLSLDTFAPTSGSGAYSGFVLTPTINQTGGSNGITRGLYINPTLSSAFDWRGIDINNPYGKGVVVTNSGVANGGIGISINNNTGGNVGIGLLITNNSTNVTATALQIEQPAGVVAKAFTYTVNGAVKVSIDNLGNISGQKIISNGVIRLTSYTVATLPTGTLGDRACVTDATTPTFLGTLTGGGAVKCPVFHNGSAWVVG